MEKYPRITEPSGLSLAEEKMYGFLVKADFLLLVERSICHVASTTQHCKIYTRCSPVSSTAIRRYLPDVLRKYRNPQESFIPGVPESIYSKNQKTSTLSMNAFHL